MASAGSGDVRAGRGPSNPVLERMVADIRDEISMQGKKTAFILDRRIFVLSPRCLCGPSLSTPAIYLR